MKKLGYVVLVVSFLILGIFIGNVVLDYYHESEEKETPAYIIRVEGHPELSYRCIDYNFDRLVNLAYNEKTKVIVAISSGDFNNGCITELHNADGSLMLYEEN